MADFPMTPVLPGAPGLAPMAGPGPATPPMTAQELPLEVRLKYGSDLHTAILSKLNHRLNISQKKIEERYDAWDEVDEHCRLFVDLSRYAKKGDKSVDTSKREQPVQRSIVVPFSYAVLDVFLTQLLGLFGSRDPMVQVQGRGPEDIQKAKIVEAVLAYDLQEMQALSVLHSFCQDAIKYGLGVVYDVWDERPGWVYGQYPETVAGQLMKLLGIPAKPVFGTLAEFCRWINVDPFLFWPDPRFPLSQLQDGEFVGHRTHRGYHWLIERKQRADGSGGPYFNLEFLSEIQAERGTEAERTRSRTLTSEMISGRSGDEKDRGVYALDHMQVKLVPSDWNLGDGEDPEIWWFTWAEKALIIRAHKSEYEHGQFTYAVGEANPDPHTLFNPGKIEDADGIQRWLDWIINANMESVRKELNDAGIVNDDLVEIQDVLNPNAGRWIRLTPKGKEHIRSGGSIEGSAIMRFPPMDRGSVNMGLVGQLFDQGQRMFGLADPIQGMPTPDKRTLGEIQQITAAASQRLSMMARLMDASAITPLARRMISNRLQFTSQPMWYRIPGSLAADMGPGPIMVEGKDAIAGNFDYLPATAMLPQDPARNAQVWIQLMEAIGKYPMLLAPGPDGKALNFSAIFKEAVTALGIRNLEQFKVQVMPNPAVAAGVQAGNLVPAGGGGPQPGPPEQGGPIG
jgi:hypothetical protein